MAANPITQFVQTAKILEQFGQMDPHSAEFQTFEGLVQEYQDTVASPAAQARLNEAVDSALASLRGQFETDRMQLELTEDGDLQRLEGRVTDLTQANTSLEGQVKRLQGQVSSLQEELAQAQAEHGKELAHATQLSSSSQQDFNAQLATLREEISSKEVKIENLLFANRDLTSNVSSLESDLESQQGQAQAEIKQLSAQLHAAQATAASAQASSTRESRDLRDENTELTAKNRDLEARLEALQSQLTAAKTELDAAKNQTLMQKIKGLAPGVLGGAVFGVAAILGQAALGLV